MIYDKKETVWKAEDIRAKYFSIIDCPDGKMRLVINRWVGIYDSYTLSSTDGIKFSDRVGLFDMSGASHNFVPFLTKEGRLMGVGGIDAWKYDPRFHRINNYDEYCNHYRDRFKKEPVTTREKFDMKQFKNKTLLRKVGLKHTDGIYLFRFEDGKWSQVGGKPIITTWHEGFNSSIRTWGKSSEFDGHISVVYNKKTDKYIIYLRNNIKKGIRFIQCSESSDLVTWGAFKNITVDQFDDTEDNYYCPNFIKHPDHNVFIGMVAFYNTKGACIKLLKSIDGINWNVKGEIMKSDTIDLNGAPKNRRMVLNGIIKRGNKISFYVHENYLGLEQNLPVTIDRYETSIEYFNRAFKI